MQTIMFLIASEILLSEFNEVIRVYIKSRITKCSLPGGRGSGAHHRLVQGRLPRVHSPGGPHLAQDPPAGREPLLPAGCPQQEGGGQRAVPVPGQQRGGGHFQQERHAAGRM